MGFNRRHQPSSLEGSAITPLDPRCAVSMEIIPLAKPDSWNNAGVRALVHALFTILKGIFPRLAPALESSNELPGLRESNLQLSSTLSSTRIRHVRVQRSSLRRGPATWYRPQSRPIDRRCRLDCHHRNCLSIGNDQHVHTDVCSNSNYQEGRARRL